MDQVNIGRRVLDDLIFLSPLQEEEEEVSRLYTGCILA